MSFLTRTALCSRINPLRVVPSSSRPFHITYVRSALSESDHNDDERKAKIDHHKDDQLKKQKEGKGHWKEELSSNSESAIKADREDIHDADKDTENLQREHSKGFQEEHEHGKK